MRIPNKYRWHVGVSMQAAFWLFIAVPLFAMIGWFGIGVIALSIALAAVLIKGIDLTV